MTILMGKVKELMESHKFDGVIYFLEYPHTEIPDDFNLQNGDGPYMIAGKSSPSNSINVPLLYTEDEWVDFIHRACYTLKQYGGRLNKPVVPYRLPSGVSIGQIAKYFFGGRFILVDYQVPILAKIDNGEDYACAAVGTDGTIKKFRSGGTDLVEWLININVVDDMLKSPLNRSFWDQVDYVVPPNPDDLYIGKHFWVHGDKQIAFVKVGDTWISTPVHNVPGMLSALDKEVSDEYNFWVSLYK